MLPVLFFAISVHAQVSQNFLTDSLPEYEIGAGAIGLNTPDYPGSENNRFRVVPFPYYIYRGKYIRSDDEGTRARLLSSKRHETGVSLGFNFPVNSEDNLARKGMPNLDAVFAFGPRLLLRFLTDVPNHRLNFTLAARAIFSSKFSFNNLFRAEGFDIEPRLAYWYRWQKSKTTVFSSCGVSFASQKANAFFYDVAPEFSTPTRNTYTSHAGLVESSVSIGLGQEITKKWFFFTGTSWRNLDNSSNLASPLLVSRNNYGVILGVVWTFYESENKVEKI